MLERTEVDSVKRSGYVIVRNSSREELAEICAAFGTITTDRRSADPFRRISPQEIELAKINTLSSRYGSGAFPFHTDAAHWREPPSYLALFCEHPGSARRATFLIDTADWPVDEKLAHEMRSQLWKAGHKNPFLCTVSIGTGEHPSIRYDMACMRIASQSTDLLRRKLEELIAASKRIEVRWETNSLLVLDNSRMLHARAAAATPDGDRVLVRALIGGQQ
jgi:alpha-ketoglutarate-dependent taurine dioxygenase